MRSMRPPRRYSSAVPAPPSTASRTSSGISVRTMRWRKDSLMVGHDRFFRAVAKLFERFPFVPGMIGDRQQTVFAKVVTMLPARTTILLQEVHKRASSADAVLVEGATPATGAA